MALAALVPTNQPTFKSDLRIEIAEQNQCSRLFTRCFAAICFSFQSVGSGANPRGPPLGSGGWPRVARLSPILGYSGDMGPYFWGWGPMCRGWMARAALAAGFCEGNGGLGCWDRSSEFSFDEDAAIRFQDQLDTLDLHYERKSVRALMWQNWQQLAASGSRFLDCISYSIRQASN